MDGLIILSNLQLTVKLIEPSYNQTIVQSFSSGTDDLVGDCVYSGLGGFFPNMDALLSKKLANGWRLGESSELLFSSEDDFLDLFLRPNTWLSFLNRDFGSSWVAFASSGCLTAFITSSGRTNIASTVS